MKDHDAAGNEIAGTDIAKREPPKFRVFFGKAETPGQIADALSELWRRHVGRFPNDPPANEDAKS